MVEAWSTVGAEVLGDHRVFKVRRDAKRSPRTGAVHPFYVLECPNWVNVVATTPDGQIVLVEQYRHGSGSVELEVPGGVMDPGETDPLLTAARELREETGYEGSAARLLGRVLPNPAIMNNVCFPVWIENCRRLHPLNLDHTEDVHTRLFPIGDLAGLIGEGRIRHSLVLVALFYFDLARRSAPAAG